MPRKMTAERREAVEGHLRDGWSPEQIAGWYRHLRRRGKKPNWRGGRHAGRGHIPGRVDIAQRPEVVDQKSIHVVKGPDKRDTHFSLDNSKLYTNLQNCGIILGIATI